MKYKRMNITLPSDVAKRLSKVPNKSAFIAQVLSERFRIQAKEERRRLLLEGYKYIAAHPEYEDDARPDW